MSLPAECVCSIEIRYGKIEEIPGRVPNAVNLPVSAHFTFCPLHEAAPKLYDALKAVLYYAEPLTDEQEKAHINARVLLENLNEQMGKQANG